MAVSCNGVALSRIRRCRVSRTAIRACRTRHEACVRLLVLFPLEETRDLEGSQHAYSSMRNRRPLIDHCRSVGRRYSVYRASGIFNSARRRIDLHTLALLFRAHARRRNRPLHVAFVLYRRNHLPARSNGTKPNVHRNSGNSACGLSYDVPSVQQILLCRSRKTRAVRGNRARNLIS